MKAPAGSTIRLNANFDNSVSIDKALTIELNGNDIINNEKLQQISKQTAI